MSQKSTTTAATGRKRLIEMDSMTEAMPPAKEARHKILIDCMYERMSGRITPKEFDILSAQWYMDYAFAETCPRPFPTPPAGYQKYETDDKSKFTPGLCASAHSQFGWYWDQCSQIKTENQVEADQLLWIEHCLKVAGDLRHQRVRIRIVDYQRLGYEPRRGFWNLWAKEEEKNTQEEVIF